MELYYLLVYAFVWTIVLRIMLSNRSSQIQSNINQIPIPLPFII